MSIYMCKSLISLYKYKPLHSSFCFSLLFSSSSSQTIGVSDYLLHRHQFSPETASKVSSSHVKFIKFPENTDSVLSFLEQSGFSKTHLEQVIKKVPLVLSANLKTIKPKLNIFLQLGFSPSDMVEIIVSYPWILTSSADNRVGPSILALRRVLGSNVDVFRVLKISGWFLRNDLEKTMVPNIEFMKSCGISSSQIKKLVYCFPRFFLLKPECIRDFVRRVDEMGFDRKSLMFLHAIRVLSSMTLKNWELKLELFRSLGFLEDDILSMFRRAPQVFAISVRKIKEGTELLLSTGKCDMSYVADHPELLIFSVENRLKPRLRVLEVLEKKNLLVKKPTLKALLNCTDEKFLKKYVLPYSNEVGELYVAYNGS